MDVFVYQRALVCVVEPPDRGAPLGHPAHWAVYDLNNNKLSWGFSKGFNSGGAGCIPMAMRNAKRAARRIMNNKTKGTTHENE